VTNSGFRGRLWQVHGRGYLKWSGTAMAAAGRLQAMIESRAGEMSMAEVMVKLSRVIEAVRSTVPREMWPEINRKIEGDDETVEPAAVEEDWGADAGEFVFDTDDFDGE
jgi:hypothetical protein